MARAWRRIDRVQLEAGVLELRGRGDGDFLILLDGRVLMNSRAHRSEAALAQLACALLAERGRPRLLLGGLGMGYTLRAALDALPQAARVTVAELNPAVVRWCREPLASLCGRPLEDPRVTLVQDDVARLVSAAARPGAEPFHAILLDLYEGPPARAHADDSLFGTRALSAIRAALTRDGVFGVWSEQPGPSFEKRLRRAGFEVRRHRPGRGGLRHAVVIARRTAGARPGSGPDQASRRSRR